ncbi:uncharacterized protein ZMO1_ZMOp39x030 (plasmid) [Zymomonas mobilis subsp. mobilis ZM4 = ATCC 31821]|uniref:Uncharacterized protein n=1 Tax=Zymomonas mobilis subsp. mobilis (strain ATCC 31821 / ZM4 / CP4) TaxID=264203 RepID=Q8GF51_ZYMMO|nr:hypothetical protein [Zymomonas mobilis]AAL36117.1 unknown [Zymomonas mobilis subsp. mobilis ZM4 = ATCC 31821]AVZ26933.1 hypothetical protein ZMO2_ZMOp39x030 [Zymomonas mobilis subsp. mobilis]AVZ28772.1 hypothetical protein ZMO3_ZMOp39x030 [Zymomonas mobilis subsp. mobilis]AVZ43265.1 uncharacterized protein ZMO1_ZMOp39x030 [Zymomonas mobilis subsp. mobilis ZM4 = ATCC 31821]UBQ08662.1 hypothetical protein LB319_09250 [Zymomonas mobilis]
MDPIVVTAPSGGGTGVIFGSGGGSYTGVSSNTSNTQYYNSSPWVKLMSPDVYDNKLNTHLVDLSVSDIDVLYDRDDPLLNSVITAIKDSDFSIDIPKNSDVKRVVFTDKVKNFAYDTSTQTYYYSSKKFLDGYKEFLDTKNNGSSVKSYHTGEIKFLNSGEPPKFQYSTSASSHPAIKPPRGVDLIETLLPGETFGDSGKPYSDDYHPVIDETKSDAIAIENQKLDGTYTNMKNYQDGKKKHINLN